MQVWSGKTHFSYSACVKAHRAAERRHAWNKEFKNVVQEISSSERNQTPPASVYKQCNWRDGKSSHERRRWGIFSPSGLVMEPLVVRVLLP